ncbi:MAG TPA: NYN domain-containing protein [Streptosporangiaceae bacterium]|nr:NYN domain-containing protein [Streptosporangiaceae bacterium]
MDRCALFVDANYALAEGALVVHGTRNRDSVSWDYAGLLKLLGSVSRDRTGLPLLRCYWYDTAADGVRGAEHETLADIPGVKLRLSKARPSRREGVEAEIRKDLTALARNHAVSDVIIVSAEEDLAPVIAEVQDLGIRTVLFHVATDADWAISPTLRQECDDIIEIGAGHLRPYVDLISGAEPQLPAAGYRELASTPARSSGPHPAIEAPSVLLFGSPPPAQYERASLASAGPGPAPSHRPDLPRFDEPAETMHSGHAVGGRESQPVLTQAGQGQVAQGRSPNYPTLDQQPVGQLEHGQQGPDLAAQAQQYRRAEPGRAEPGRGQQPVGTGAGFDSAGFGGQPNRGAPGQLSLPAAAGYDQRGPDVGHGRPGSLGQPGPPPGANQNGAAHNGASPGHQGQSQFGQSQFGQSQFGQPPFAQSQFGQPQFGQSQFGQLQHGHDQGGRTQPGHGSQPATPAPANGDGGQHAGTFTAHGAAHRDGAGSETRGQPGNGVAPAGPLANRMSAAPGAQGNSMPAGFQAQNGVPPNGMPADGLPASGIQASGPSSGPRPMPGPAPRGAAPHHDGTHGQPGYRQHAPGPADAGAGQRVGSHAAPAAGPPNGIGPLDGQRPPLPQRQLPSANGMPYAQDRSMPYGGSGQPGHFSGQVVPAAYGQNSYGSQQPAVAPVGMPVGDAVQSAHGEGFGFGEAVARDAPALWLEAVLARKPRMPSDLEARLLQGSALPIDSLLHDEVRHALRRGFWDALERSRR